MIKRYTETKELGTVDESPTGEYVRLDDIKPFIQAILYGPDTFELEYQEAIQELSQLIE